MSPPSSDLLNGKNYPQDGSFFEQEWSVTLVGARMSLLVMMISQELDEPPATRLEITIKESSLTETAEILALASTLLELVPWTLVHYCSC